MKEAIPMEAVRRARWITIAAVKPDWQLRGDALAPRRGIGLALNWRGRMDWCQPWEFDDFDQVVWAVERRLKIAGLALLTLASALPVWPVCEVGFYVLRAEVTRQPLEKNYA